MRFLIPVVLTSVLILAGNSVVAQQSDPAYGAQLLAPFKRQLQAALQEGLAQGPAEAIAACQVRAPEIVSELSQDGVRLGRASHRLRNPANVAPDWVQPILDGYARNPAVTAPQTVAVSADRTGYVEPIIVQPLCLTCHGSNISADVADKISRRYPQDRATDYAVGDLRGVFWVEFPDDG